MKFNKYIELENTINEMKALAMSPKAFATVAHQGQTRKFAGEPYVEHPKRVAKIVKKFKGNSHKLDALTKAALLHDTIEDTDTTEEDLKRLYGGLVASLVKELSSDTKEIKNAGKASYLSSKLSGMSSWGLVIKLADRLDNVSDLFQAGKTFRDKYTRETKIILKNLKQNRKLTATQMKLISAIEDKLKEAEEV